MAKPAHSRRSDCRSSPDFQAYAKAPPVRLLSIREPTLCGPALSSHLALAMRPDHRKCPRFSLRLRGLHSLKPLSAWRGGDSRQSPAPSLPLAVSGGGWLDRLPLGCCRPCVYLRCYPPCTAECEKDPEQPPSQGTGSVPGSQRPAVPSARHPLHC